MSLVTSWRFNSSITSWVGDPSAFHECRLALADGYTNYPHLIMNTQDSFEAIQQELDQLRQDVESITKKRYPRFGSGRLASKNGAIHFTTQPIEEGEA